MVICFGSESTHRASDDAREFSILKTRFRSTNHRVKIDTVAVVERTMLMYG